jgi:membrane protein YdbS with pleckstrin-like domain
MNPEQQPDPSGGQPAAYDVQGRPLYYRAEVPAPAVTAAPATTEKDAWTPELQTKHDESIRDYPEIPFSDTEYVVIDVQRTIWGLVFIWAMAIAVFAVMVLFAFTMMMITDVNPFAMFVIVSALGVMCLAGGMVGQYVFHKNSFVVTNERIIQRAQTSPFSYRTQIIELEHVEDCSYRQIGPIQMMLNYGTIRLSTISEEQTYRFTFVTQPVEQFKVINKVIQIVDEDISTRYRL